MNRYLFFCILVVINLSLMSQVKVGEWKDYLPYNRLNSVTKLNEYVYASNGYGILKYNTTDNSVEKLTKINGLSDVGVKLLRTNTYNNVVVVIYDNSNIDVIRSDGSIVNISDIKRKVITGNKIINDVSFYNQLAYISCGFGIVVFDTDKLEIKDTYIIGAGASNINVFQVARNDSVIIAATQTGVYKASAYSNALNNFQNWAKQTNLPNGYYNCAVNYNGKLIINYSEWKKNGTNNKDTLYYHNGGTQWLKSTILAYPYIIKKMQSYNTNGITFIDQFGVRKNDGVIEAYITNYGFGGTEINDVFFESHEPDYNIYWCADKNHGLVKSYGQFPYSNEKITISGPNTSLVNSFSIKDNKLVVAPMRRMEEGSLYYINEAIYVYENGEWLNPRVSMNDTIWDVTKVLIDKDDKNHYWASSYSAGVLEYRNNQLINVYNSLNSSITYAGQGRHIALGLDQDETGNLWVGCPYIKNFLSVKKTNGTWQNFNFSSFINSPAIGQVMVDKNNQKWVILDRGAGLLVYNDKGTFAQPNTSNTKLITTAQGNGKLPSLEVVSIAEDLEGQVWVGTAKGVTVFYSPETIFSGGNWDSQQILIEQDGHVQILLETEKVTAIAIDGANRKWIGTESSGVFCFSPDGQQEIYHFTEENSPLYSDDVRDIAIDETSGDVFIGTDKGIQSYRIGIIKAFEEFTDVHAYPNPVRPGFNGNVYITGLIDEAIVKITDVTGNIVYETKSQGGQVEWNVKNFSGQKVASGVYIVYCASSDGVQSAVTKILVVN